MLLKSPLQTKIPCPRRWRLCAWGLTLLFATVLSVLTLRPPSAVAAEKEKAKSSGFVTVSSQEPEATGGAKADMAGNDMWFVMPVTTECQRITAGRDARAYVLVNGEALRQNRVTLDGRALNLEGLREQLKPYADPENGTVHFYIRCVMGETHMVKEGRFIAIMEGSPDGPPPKKDYVTDMLRWALIGFGKDAGFRDATAGAVYHGGEKSWETVVAELKKGLAEDAGRDDLGIGNERFKVYRVETALSRFLYKNADCLLHVEVEGGIGSKDLDAIEESVGKLNLKKREWLFLHVSQVVGRFLRRDTFWKERLGFKHYRGCSGYRPLGISGTGTPTLEAP